MKKIFQALVLMVAVFLTACAQPEIPKDNFYRAQVPDPQAPLDTPRLQGTVEVELTANGLVDGRSIIYSEPDKPNQLKEYHYHFWSEPPKIMLRDQLIAYLRTANVANKVVTNEMRADPQYMISGKIKRLEKVTGKEPRAIVELELALMKAGTGNLLVLSTYGIDLPAKDNTVAAAVTAINEALSQIFARFVGDIEKMKKP